MAAGLLEDDDDQRHCMEKHPWAKHIVIAITILFLASVCYLCWDSLPDMPPSEFWVKLPGVEGLERSADAVISPTFNITLRVNKGVSTVLCGRGDRVDVAYDGVPLAHGKLPDFCVPPATVGSVPVVVASGEGLGLPDELYERMERQRQRNERLSLAVQVRMHEITGSRGSPLLLWCTAIQHGQPRGPFLCEVFGLPTRDFPMPEI